MCILLIYNCFSTGIAIILILFYGRLRAAGKSNADGPKKARTRERSARAMPAPEANAELQTNLDVCQPTLLFILVVLYKNLLGYMS